MLRGVMSQRGLGSLVVLYRRIAAHAYLDILVDSLYPKIQTLFPSKPLVYQDNNVLIQTTAIFRNWYNEHGDELQQLVWPPSVH